MLKNIARTAAIASISLAVGAVALVATPPKAEANDWRVFGRALADGLKQYGDSQVDYYNRQMDRQRSCTTSFIGNTAYTNCY